MSKGFSIDFLDRNHGFWSPAGTGLKLLSRSIGDPPRDDHTERVPYSNITHDFDDFHGASGYGERTLVYKYDFLCRDCRRAEQILVQIKRKLRWRGRRDLYDDAFPDYHFEVREPTVKAEDGQFTVHFITITFKAAPAMLPNQVPALRESEQRYPDLNGDGAVTAADAAIILTAAENIAAGKPGGLTAAQELLADADLDGTVTEADSVLVLQYAAAVSAGEFADTPEQWQRYLRRYFAVKGGVY